MQTKLPVDRERDLNLSCQLSTLALTSATKENQFGASLANIEKWKRFLCQTEVDERRIRNQYQIEWDNSHPLADDFLWTNLANKVSSLFGLFSLSHNLLKGIRK